MSGLAKPKCLLSGYSTSWSYKNLKCRCLNCVSWSRSVHKKFELNSKAEGTWLVSKRNAKLKYRYNISLVDYNNLLQAQNFVCALCYQKDLARNQTELAPLKVDHDHNTGKVRGLLCDNCNVGLGRFKDNSNTLQNAINYLKGEHNHGRADRHPKNS